MFQCIWYHNIGLHRGEHTHFNSFSFCFFSTFLCELVQLRQVQQPVASCKHSPTIITRYTLYMHSEGVHALLSCSIDHVSLIAWWVAWGGQKGILCCFFPKQNEPESERQKHQYRALFHDSLVMITTYTPCRYFAGHLRQKMLRACAKCDYTKLKMTPY